MPTFIQNFLLSVVPLFIAIDPPMAIPAFLIMTERSCSIKKQKVANEAVIAAFAVGILFLALGQMVFGIMGITENDFRIGGGIVLLVLSVSYLVFPKHPEKNQQDEHHEAGAVPLGVPLIMGPAAITTIVLMTKTYGYFIAFAAVSFDLFLVWICFSHAKHIVRWIGIKNIQVISKIASLLLVSIAVTMIRVGVKSFYP